MVSNFFISTCMFYLLSFLGFFWYWKTLSFPVLRLSRWVFGLAVIIHLGGVLAWLVSRQMLAPSTSWESLFVIGMFLGVMGWIFSLRKSFRLVNLLILPIVISTLIGFYFFGSKPGPSLVVSSWLWVHIVFAILGEALFCVAALVSVVFLILDYRFKSRSLSGWMTRIPSRHSLDRFMGDLLVGGFACLTLGLILGLAFADTFWAGWYLDPKVSIAFGTWCIYAVLLSLRTWKESYRGSRSAWISVIGFICILFLSLGMDVFVTSDHPFNPMTPSIEGRP